MTFTCAISIVLPLYKPSGNWQASFLKNIPEVEKLFETPPIFIVVNDGSAEQSIDAFFNLIKTTHPNILYCSYAHNMGKGYALRRGVELATSQYIIIIDFDFPYIIQNLEEMVKLLENGCDLVTGKRATSYFKNLPFKRKVASKVYLLCNSLFLRLPVNDTQSGIKAFNRIGSKVFSETTTNRFLIDTELILRASLYNIKHKVITVTLKPQIQFTDFKWHQYVNEFFEFLKIVKLKIALRRRHDDALQISPDSFITLNDQKQLEWNGAELKTRH